MKLIKIPLAILFVVGPCIVQADVLIDVSGSPGQNGRNGTSHSTYSGASSGRGDDGGHATKSIRGGEAKNINVELKDVGQERAKLVVIGSAANRPVNKSLSVTASTKILLQAKGGRGGDGGNGGDGEGGCNGDPGQDADRYSVGTDGGSGCPGGDGGNATPGSDGGPGGDIVVKLSDEDLHLSILVDWNVAGGEGGDGSRNGRPGQGGRGGRGGSSHSWTTYEDYQTTCTETRSKSVRREGRNADGSTYSYTDYVNEYVSVPCTKTRAVSHHNRGGSTGPSGSSGSSGRGDTSAGRKGPSGSFKFIVTSDDGGTKEYEKSFELQLLSYRVSDEDGNGIYEPGETLKVSHITVFNNSKMPTPGAKAKVIISLASSSWFVADPQELEIKQLQGNEKRVLSDELFFKVRNNHLPVSEKLAFTEDTIVPFSHITRMDHRLSSFRLPQTLTVSYPIELTSFSAKTRLGPGESSPLVWKIKNLSQKPIGLLDGQQRQINIDLKRNGGDAEKESLIFTTPEGDSFAIDDQIWNKSVDQIEPGQSFVVEGQISVNEKALPYTREEVETTLNLSDFLNAQNIEKIQLGKINFAVGQTYRHTPGAEFLIVTNASTTRQQIVSLEEFFRKIGLKYDIWDYSYYGFFSLIQDLEFADGKSLLENYAGKTILFLTNSSLAESEGEALLREITYDQFILAASDQRTNFVLVGDNRDRLKRFIETKTFPARAVKNQVYEKPSELIDAIEESKIVGLQGAGFKFESDADSLKKELRRASKKAYKVLKKLDQNRLWYVTYQTTPSQNKPSRFNGEVIYHRALNYSDGRMTVIVETPQHLESPDYYGSEEFFRHLVLGMGFQQKLALASSERKLWSTNQNNLLSQALIADLIEEIDLLEATKFSGNHKLFINSLPKAGFGGYFESMVEVLAKGYFYADIVSDAFGDKVGDKYKNLILEGGSSYIGKNKKSLEKDIVDKIASLNLEVELDKRSKVLRGFSQRKNARDMLTLPIYYHSQRSLDVVQKRLDTLQELQWERRSRESF